MRSLKKRDIPTKYMRTNLPHFYIELKKRQRDAKRGVNKKGIGKCCDCGNWNDWYMVVPEVWNEAVQTNPVNLLCLSCLSTRLGRDLVESDFSSSTLNNPVRVGIAIGKKESPFDK